MNSVRTFRIAAWCLVAIFAAYLLIFGFVSPVVQQGSGAVSGISEPAIGKPFELVSPDGRTVNNATLRGKPYLSFFGFTHCPDICPTTLFELTDLMNELGPAADRLNVVFITVDPERDTDQMLQGYMSSFDPRIMALRGTAEQTQVAVQAFAAYAKKVPTDGASYTMDHTAGVYLMDENGVFKGTLDMHEPRDIRLQKIRNLIGAPD